MWMICKKEWQQFFGSITGYMSIAIFLVINGIYLFLLPETNILDFGYATLSSFFNIAPWILLFFVPTVTMRTFSDEKKSGTIEILQTLPINSYSLIIGKFLGNYLVASTVLFPTIIYAICIQLLSSVGGLDWGAVLGSYIGLLLLIAAYTAIGIFTSSTTSNAVIAFIAAAFLTVVFLFGLGAVSKFSWLNGSVANAIEMMGIGFHYKSLSRGVIDLRDVLFFLSVISLFLWLSYQQIITKETID